MSAPWGVEFEEDVLLVVDDDVLVVLRHNNGHGTFLLLGDGLRFDAWLDFASHEVIDELANLLLAEVLDVSLFGERELLILLGVLDGERGPLADLEVEVASVLAEGLGVDGCEVDGALVLFSDGLEGFGERLALFGSLSEDVCERDAGLLYFVSSE